MTAVIASLGAALIAAAVSIVSLCLQRNWKKDDQSAGKLDELAGQVQSVKNTLDRHIATDAENDARQARRRIIAFADECRREEQHSEEHFDNVLEDITFYRQYCDDHPKFKNEKASHSIRYIEDVYDVTKRKNAFI
jgi:hypothetical protein